ncbi:hypothetical protein BGZ73_007852 [Actinomortierella ambigua]|nr:hypothetical protein BGZ73_007852 [Actinomortierella ambigua]
MGATPRVNTEMTFSGSSKVTQMTSRQRRWEPRTLGETNNIRKIETSGSVQYLRASNPDDWFPEETIFDIVHQERKDAYRHAVYDPYRGNLCASGRFLGLPVIASPMGELANELEEILVRTRESITIVAAHPDAPQAISRIEPQYIQRAAQLPARPDRCSDLTIHAAFSPYIPHQYALVGDRGRVAIWTRDASLSSSSIAPHTFASDNTSSNNISSSGRSNIFSRSSSIFGQGDNTLSYEDCVYRENELDDYIMAVDGMTMQERLSRGSKRRNLREASGGKRVRMETDESEFEPLDMPMGKNVETKLYDVRKSERIVAIQEADRHSGQPFQRYLATNLQILCLDQRMPNRPLISWAHHQGREEPRGIEVAEARVGGMDMSIVTTWSERNAYISSTAYTHTSAYRETRYQWCDELDEQGERMMSLKPALHGFSWIPRHVIEEEGSEDDEEEEQDEQERSALNEATMLGSHGKIKAILARRHQRLQARVQRRREQTGHLAIFQYSATGAIYGQSVDILPRFSGPRFGFDFASGRSMNEIYQEYQLRSQLAKANPGSRDTDRLYQMKLGRVFQALGSQVAPWKTKGRKKQPGDVSGEEEHGEEEEVEMQADQEVVSAKEVREHMDLDLTSLVEFLKGYLEMDRETDLRTSQIIADANCLSIKVDEAVQMVRDRAMPNMTLFELIREIRCLDVPLRHRDALKRGIEAFVNQGSLSASNPDDDTDEYPSASTSTSGALFQKIIPAWNAKEMKLRIDPSSSKVTTEQLERDLEHQYPWPRTVKVTASNEADTSLVSSMANMHMRSGGSSGNLRGMSSSPSTDQQRSRSSAVEWPSPAAKLVRHRTVERLAQDLQLSSSLVVKGCNRSRSSAETAQQEALAPLQAHGEQAAAASTDGTPNPASNFSDKEAIDFKFRYLLQSGSGGKKIASQTALAPPSPVMVPIRVKPILQEWVVGTDPYLYKYVPPGVDAGEEDLEEERVRREAQEQEEKLLRLRMRREKRQAKVRETRARDMFHESNSTGGSFSQPASLSQKDSGVGIGSSSWSRSYDDDDFTFSALPTVVSTSQAAAAARAKKAAAGKPIGKPTGKLTAPAGSGMQTVAAASSSNSNSTRRLSDSSASLKKTVSFSMQQAGFGNQADELPASQPTQMPIGNSASLDAVFEATMDLPASQDFGTRDDFISASQPVPGAFGSRGIAAAAKKKKKKPRTQGF